MSSRGKKCSRKAALIVGIKSERAFVCKKRRKSETWKHICDVNGSENLTKYRRTKKITGQIGPWFKGLHLKPLRYRGTIVNQREWTSELVIQLTKAVTINFSHRFVHSFVCRLLASARHFFLFSTGDFIRRDFVWWCGSCHYDHQVISIKYIFISAAEIFDPILYF